MAILYIILIGREIDMPARVEINYKNPYFVIERTRDKGLLLELQANEMDMAPIPLRPGKHRSTIGTEITIGRGNVG